MTALSVERCIEVTDTQKRTSTKYKLTVTCFFLIAIWSTALLIAILMMLSFEARIALNGSVSCETTWTADEINAFFVAKYVLVFVIPFGVILVSSGKLLKFLIEWRRKMSKMKTHVKIFYKPCNSNEPAVKIETPRIKLGFEFSFYLFLK